MPVENELKFVLHVKEEKIASLAKRVYLIEQGYLHCNKSLTVRIRKQTEKKKVKHIMTLKQKTSKVIEIEKRINEEDYTELSSVCTDWVRKVRYVVGSWEVDFFKNDNNTYFVMAEIEMP